MPTSVFTQQQQDKWARVTKLRDQIDEMLRKGLSPNEELLLEYAELVGPQVYETMAERVAAKLEEIALTRLINEARGGPGVLIEPGLTNRLLAAILLKLHGKSLT